MLVSLIESNAEGVWLLQVNPLQGLSKQNVEAAVRCLTSKDCQILPSQLDSVIAAKRQLSQEAEVMARLQQSGAAGNDDMNMLLQKLYLDQAACVNPEFVRARNTLRGNKISQGLAKLKQMAAAGELGGDREGLAGGGEGEAAGSKGGRATECEEHRQIAQDPVRGVALAETVTEVGSAPEVQVLVSSESSQPKRVSKFKQARLSGKDTGNYCGASRGQKLNV